MVECCIGQLIRHPCLLAGDSFHEKVVEGGDELLGLVVERAQVSALDLVVALHLAGEELRIGADFERLPALVQGVVERRQQGAVFGDVVGGLPQVSRKFPDHLSLRVLKHNAVSGRAGIAAGGAVNDGGNAIGRDRTPKGIEQRRALLATSGHGGQLPAAAACSASDGAGGGR
jgi:hypothetical protein